MDMPADAPTIRRQPAPPVRPPVVAGADPRYRGFVTAARCDSRCLGTGGPLFCGRFRDRHMTGIRAELVFERTAACPVAEATTTATGPVTDITWTGTDDRVTEQVTVTATAGGSAAAATDETVLPGDGPTFERVFDYGTREVYEFERDRPEPCVCEYIEQEVGPVSDVYAAERSLHVTLHVGDVDAVRELLGNLEDRFGDVRIEYLVRSRVDTDDAELVPVDLRRLTERQREVLERAYTLGYFEYPRESNASEVADSLGIGPSTFIEGLNAAQSKLLSELLDRG